MSHLKNKKQKKKILIFWNGNRICTHLTLLGSLLSFGVTFFSLVPEKVFILYQLAHMALYNRVALAHENKFHSRYSAKGSKNWNSEQLGTLQVVLLDLKRGKWHFFNTWTVYTNCLIHRHLLCESLKGIFVPLGLQCWKIE